MQISNDIEQLLQPENKALAKLKSNQTMNT